MNRRSFLKAGLGVSAAALAGAPDVAHAAVTNPVLVVLFLRGGLDALSLLPPRDGTNATLYAKARPSVAIDAPATLSSGGGGFGIHPAVPKLRALYEGGEAAFVVGAGSPNQTRSHFEQVAFIESGNPVTRAASGYLNRALAVLPSPGYVLQGIAMQGEMPLGLRGPASTLKIGSLDGFGTLQRSGLEPGASYATRAAELTIAPTSTNATVTEIRDASAVLRASITEVRRIVSAAPAVSSTSAYGSSDFGGNLRDAARAIAVQPKVRIIEIEHERFDTHAAQGDASGGTLVGRLRELDTALGAFVADAKSLGFWSRTCVLVISEFGRTVDENGTKGTDHGRGGVAFVAGPSTIVRGKRVVVPSGFSLASGALVDGRDLPVKTDLRAIAGEVLTKHLGASSLGTVFPGWTPTSAGLLV